MSLWYVSFADPGAWKGAGFVEANGPHEANEKAKPFHPGGQVLCFKYSGLTDAPTPPEEMMNRLLGREELLKLWPDAKDIMAPEDHYGDDG